MIAPKVSVALVTFNHISFIGECLSSIVEQDYPNIEVIVADDASTDGSQEVIREFARRYPDIIKLSLSETNEGASRNANRCFGKCTGDFICYMDGDDLMLPGKLSSQVARLQDDPDCVICYHDMDVFESSTGATLHKYNSGPQSNVPREGGVENLILYGTFLGATSVMFRRSAMPAKGLDVRLRASDWLFWIEVSIGGGRISYIPKVLGRYRRHANNMSSLPNDFTDQFITLAIIDAKYPQYAGKTRQSRSALWLTRAVGALKANDRRNCIYFAMWSLREHPIAAFRTAVTYLRRYRTKRPISPQITN